MVRTIAFQVGDRAVFLIIDQDGLILIETLQIYKDDRFWKYRSKSTPDLYSICVQPEDALSDCCTQYLKYLELQQQTRRVHVAVVSTQSKPR